MCTALGFKTDFGCFFGRNMDLSYSFNQSPIFLNKGFHYLDPVTNKTVALNRSIIGMGTVIDNHPALAEGMNCDRLGCAGLNFSRYAYYEKNTVDGKINLAPYDFILYILSNFSSVTEIKENLPSIELVSIPINKDTPIATLHWMICDRTGASIVVERTKSGLICYDNPVGVMTNDPPFDWHLTNLNEYIKISPFDCNPTAWSNHQLKGLGVGNGALGLPGDFESVSRFVRAAFLRANLPQMDNENEAISLFFHILDNVAMPKGSVIVEGNRASYTLYSSCMNLDKGIYYFRTYQNSRISAINMNNVTTDVMRFDYPVNQDINHLN